MRSPTTVLSLIPLVGAACLTGIATDPQQPAPQQQREAAAEDAMQLYLLGFLRPGDKRAEATAKLAKKDMAKLQAEHQAYIGKMARTGKLTLAGPFIDRPKNDPISGLFLFPVTGMRKADLEAARKEVTAMVSKDPFISRGVLKLDLRAWYGAAGITYKDHAKYLPKKSTSRPVEKHGR